MNQPLKSSTPQPNASIFSVWLALAFRPFFLLAPLVSLLTLVLWSQVLNGSLVLNVYGGALWWHMHEMLFGFSSAVIAGFLLTAVKNWTGLPGFTGWKLGALVLLWLLARLSFPLSNYFPNAFIIALDISFLPITATILMIPIIKVKRWRNLIFLPILLVMTLANVLMHYAAVNNLYLLAQQASYLMVMAVVFLITVMAGRIFPMFTANGTRTQRVDNLPWLEKSILVSTLLSALVISFPSMVPAFINSLILCLAFILHCYRALRWRPQVTLGTPLVWSLHLSYWCIALGLGLFALEPWFGFISRAQALHSLTVGGIGLMILAMISRVSLGHTGRVLRVGKWMVGAFLAVFMAFLVRVFGVYLGSNYAHVMAVSIGFWSVGYGLFVIHFLPILTKPRSDGQPG